VSGCWVTWPAAISIRQDIVDIGPYLAHAVTALREHRDVDDARYEYDPRTSTVSFVLQVRHGITEVIAKRQASDALHGSLPHVGFATSPSHRPFQPPVAWLRLDWWPCDFKWW
jgi:hypothetical protein